LIASKEDESDLALDFSSFLLRYHRDLDYGDFADDQAIS
jgi:hypothetical protein